ncbi:putative golgin-45 [Apostichopus japonicus]|uniref:Putative golgin-45 n=1 Tax=Stichopus japonicus TaxID=307972 RepID=A0A2G8JYS0_STIJA|nr:putative golgin-45 [Apostichopus japonicus]
MEPKKDLSWEIPDRAQYIDRGVFTTSQPRPAIDGLESDISSADTSVGGTPHFFDTKNRNSTELAYKERQQQKDSSFLRTLDDSLYQDSSFTSLYSRESTYISTDSLLNELQQLRKELETSKASSEAFSKVAGDLKEKEENAKVELERQSQVNKELKKLLVASMGADLQVQMEKLLSDKAQLSQDLENTISILAKERETLERVNIQCDVWRSKFLGSRLQVDEVVSSRTRLNMLLQESMYALQRLLEERSEMRQHMIEANRTLQYLSNALQRSQSLASDSIKPPTNVLTLALCNQQLSSTISHHLLGDVVVKQNKKKHEGPFEFIEWTTAEMLAKDIVLNKQPELKKAQVQQAPIQPTTASTKPQQMVHRYHPQTRYENITLNCCKYCRGI